MSDNVNRRGFLKKSIIAPTAALALRCSGSIVQSAILGNVAAAVVCESEGNCPVQVEDMLEKLG